jgi:hypothetical protein
MLLFLKLHQQISSLDAKVLSMNFMVVQVQFLSPRPQTKKKGPFFCFFFRLLGDKKKFQLCLRKFGYFEFEKQKICPFSFESL